MSAFLGPVHTWLYNKIKFQDAMVSEILNMAEEKDCAKDLRSRTDGRYGVLGSGSLEEMVDPGNIHGWLQEKVDLVENRLAYAVTELLAVHPERLSMIKEAVYELGKRNSPDKDAGVREAYEYLENTLLNGMPCDRVNELVQETADRLVWKQTQDIHGAYWNLIHGDVKLYYAIRESLMKGILEHSGTEFNQIGDQEYELRRRLCMESIS